MSKDSKNSSLNVDLGASIKAEISAEVPSSSMGRLVDSITDAIRPFTEARGLRADLIRLQRENVALEIARLAQTYVEASGRGFGVVPNRVIVPLLEKGSLAEPEDSGLISAWANLLSTASIEGEQNTGIFVDLLSKLGPSHVLFLDKLCEGDMGIRHVADAPYEYSEEEQFASLVALTQDVEYASETDEDGWATAYGQICARIKGYYERFPGVGLIYFGFSTMADGWVRSFDTQDILIETDLEQSSFDALEALGIVKQFEFSNYEPPINQTRPLVSLRSIRLSNLGAEFVVACKGCAVE